MLNSKYHRGITSLIHDNGRGRAFWDHCNPFVTLDQALDNCYFDLGNRNRGNNPMYRVGHMITIEASDGCTQVRIMSMGPDNLGITVRPVAAVIYFEDDAEEMLGIGQERVEPAPLARAQSKPAAKRRGPKPGRRKAVQPDPEPASFEHELADAGQE
jgi:hypothetical protein